MLATILKSKQATETTLMIIEVIQKWESLDLIWKELSEIKTESEKHPLMKRSGELIAEIFDNDLDLNETETTLQINFAVLKLKNTVKISKN